MADGRIGGSAAIMLKRPDDPALLARVAGLLDRLARDPALGIARVLEAHEIARAGGTPQASFLVAFRPRPRSGPRPVRPARERQLLQGHARLHVQRSGDAIQPVGERPALARHGDLGTIEMRAIAPWVARMLGMALPSAEAAPAF